MDLSTKEYDELVESIFNLMLKKGLKELTMDSVAKELGMSKRTLYEIFNNKVEMVGVVLERFETQVTELSMKNIRESANMLEWFIRIFKIHRNFMCNVNIRFFRDMDRLYPELKEKYKTVELNRTTLILDCLKQGVEEGLFRREIDYLIQLRMLRLQMESLKRMEELFPPDIPLVRVYDTIYLGFLRSIVTIEGFNMLDEYNAAIV